MTPRLARLAIVFVACLSVGTGGCGPGAGGGSGGSGGGAGGGAGGNGGGMDGGAEALAPVDGQGAMELCVPTRMDLFEDDFAVGSEWSAEPIMMEGTQGNTVMQQSSAGNPGGYRRMTHTVGPPPGPSRASSVWLAHLYSGGTYDPASGAVCSLVYREDQINHSSPAQVIWGAVLVQGDKTFYHRPEPQFSSATWARRGPYVLVPGDFMPAPGPDFSIAGEPLVFGYLRASSSGENPAQSQMIQHGIDNWRVEVRHK